MWLETLYVAFVTQGPIIVCLNDDLGLPRTILCQGQIWSLMLLFGGKEKLLPTGPVEAKLHMEPQWDTELKFV